jgi:hypothetical protein
MIKSRTGMKTRMRVGLLACLALGLTQVAHADPFGPDRGVRTQYHYPRAGYQVRALPRERHVIVAPGGGRYFYSRGVWYAPRGPNFVVVHAPIGVFVPVLPPFYTSIWFGPTRYFVADDTYYVWRDQQHAYQVVEPPEQAAGSTASSNNDIFMYPKNGQAPDQQARDRYECHSWAKGETQFDPTMPGGGVADDQNASKRSDYRRAMAACLEGRGYSVK